MIPLLIGSAAMFFTGYFVTGLVHEWSTLDPVSRAVRIIADLTMFAYGIFNLLKSRESI
jgi:hypothetical protein